ncbi:hypothetical protein LXL04_025584 [Taraxacum kok-saghyz]
MSAESPIPVSHSLTQIISKSTVFPATKSTPPISNSPPPISLGFLATTTRKETSSSALQSPSPIFSSFSEKASPEFSVLISPAVLKVHADGLKVTFDEFSVLISPALNKELSEMKNLCNSIFVMMSNYATNTPSEGDTSHHTTPAETTTMKSLDLLSLKLFSRESILKLKDRRNNQKKLNSYGNGEINAVEVMRKESNDPIKLSDDSVTAITGAVSNWEQDPRCFPLGNFDGAMLTIGSSPRFPMFDIDFGWGKPIAVRSGRANKFDGKISAFPGKEVKIDPVFPKFDPRGLTLLAFFLLIME